jgi:hypothetical protein
MNLTVGPLPPSVYWRRRVLVLGGLLLVVLLVAYACSGSGASSASTQPTPAPVLAPIPTSSPSPSMSPSSSMLPSVDPSGTTTQPTSLLSPSVSASAPMVDASPADDTCTDDQIQVTPVIASTSAATSRLELGGTYDLRLKIRNISKVTCRRDVGTVAEELRITKGSTKIWSSDDCVHPKTPAHDIRTFAPGIEIYAEIKWSSYDITTTTCKKSSDPAPQGKYSLIGRVGTKSTTVPFKIS